MTSSASSTFTLSPHQGLITQAVDRIIATHRALDRSFARHQPLRRVRMDRRMCERVEIRLPVDLTPVVEEDGVITCIGDMVIGVTRDIGMRGMGLSVDCSLESPLILAEFDVCRERPVRLLLKRRWQRRIDPFSFETGGRFTGILLEASTR